ncbi:helix-turn-helix domain-containing protein [Tersicoccus sp. MR15.9]|uniref:helix-turn-helix domain-containing protein n=1 Tax=Tersicoccus mangrovi TaxID=3121635 RepID=UPI002FE50252
MVVPRPQLLVTGRRATNAGRRRRTHRTRAPAAVATGLPDTKRSQKDDTERSCSQFNVLGMVAEFEADLIRMRTREGMAIAKTRGRLKGRAPSLSPSRRRHLLTLVDAGDHTHTELAELFQVSRATVYREIRKRSGAPLEATSARP